MSNEEDKSDIFNKLRSLLEQERRRKCNEHGLNTSIEAVTKTIDEYTLIYQDRYNRVSKVIEGSRLIEKSENRVVVTPPPTRDHNYVRERVVFLFVRLHPPIFAHLWTLDENYRLMFVLDSKYNFCLIIVKS